MLYLEDYLEIIEHLPEELRTRFTQIRELDLQVNNDMDKMDLRLNHFFSTAHTLSPDVRDSQFQKIREDYSRILEYAEEKVSQVNQVHVIIEKYLRRLDNELHKFKIELEADNAGITEILEKRSLELDVPPQSTNVREKRKLGWTASATEHRSNSSSHEKTPIAHYSSIDNGLNTSLPNYSKKLTSANTPRSNIVEGLGHLAAFVDKSSGSSVTPSIPNAMAAAASQAILVTQLSTHGHGRRTASMKASFEAVNSGLGIDSLTVKSHRSDEGDYSSAKRDSLSEPTLSRPTKQRKKQDPGKPMDEQEHNISDQQDDGVLYCSCKQVSYGQMIMCENMRCPNGQWFHYDCVNISKPPKGEWYCNACKGSRKKIVSTLRDRSKSKKLNDDDDEDFDEDDIEPEEDDDRPYS